MVPTNPLPSFLIALLFGLSLFYALRLLFAHDMRREAWRSIFKRHFYISQKSFKLLSCLAGWIFLFIALSTAFHEVDHLLRNG